VIETLGKMDCTTEYPPGNIMAHLGISLDSLRGLKVLDIGCGLKAGFVKHLRKNGIQAWGIDRLLDVSEVGEYTANAEALEIPDFGMQFDVAIAHFSAFRWGSSFFVDTGIKRGALNQQDYEKNLLYMGYTILNLRKSIKSGGKLIIFPCPNELLSIISDYQFTIEDIPEEPARISTDVDVDFQIYPELKQRLIITMSE